MTSTPRLLRRVRNRQIISAIVKTFEVSTLVLCGIYAVALLAARLTGLMPDYFHPVTLALPLGLGILIALIFHRRPKPEQTAHLIDKNSGQKDLFLTALLLDKSLGGFQSIVRERADEAAAQVKPATVARIDWERPARNSVTALALLASGIFLLPQLDPFGREQARAELVKKNRELAQIRESVVQRKEALSKRDIDAALSKEVEERLAALRKTLDMAKPADKEQNAVKLTEQQKNLSEMWRKEGEQRLRDALERNPMNQQFGALTQNQEAWKKELEKGNMAGIQQELGELQKLARDVAQMKDGAQKEAKRQELAKRAREAAQFIAKQANNAPANAAMQKALNELGNAAKNGMDPETAQALQNALDLTNKELAAMGQNIRDMQALEDAMKAAQLARELNEAGKLDGEGEKQGGEDQDMADYAAHFAQLLAQMQAEGMGEGQGMGDGNGNGGMGGQGHGQGGQAPEDESVATNFQTEKSKSAMRAGKMLMEWKVNEMGPKGDFSARYSANIAAVKQGVSEAILAEQVPPGYHDAIQKYFDTLEPSSGGTEK